MRHYLKRLLPGHAAIRDNRWLRPFHSSLLHPRLWHLNRHSAAGAVAIGLFCGLIPGPFQMLGAALGALVFRANLPLALLTTLYTNPFTIVPLYIVAFEFGRLFIGNGERFITPPDFLWQDLPGSFSALATWMLALGKPLALGLPLLAGSLAFAGYFLTKAGWRVALIRAWRRRAEKRKPAGPAG